MSQHILEPAARIINAIGKDLIKDVPASVVELVKNSYDADASFVELIFSIKNEELQIEIRDDGHGMSEETIVSSWLVPGTDYKLQRKKSPKKRAYQGRKGIGRYAAAVLGSQLELESIQGSNKTIARIDWTEFEKKKYLKDVEIFLHTEQTKLQQGTRLLITGGKEYIELLNEKEVNNIIKELRKLKSPLEDETIDVFDIYLEFKDFYKEADKNIKIEIEPFPILEMYNYRLSGTIDSKGRANLLFENAYKTPVDIQKIEKQIVLEEHEYYCGNIQLDFRVYDKDVEGINFLLNRLGKDKPGETIGSRFARQLLKDLPGVGIYRNGFRIRPHGDLGFDWLNLDNRRIQNPSLKIGSDQTAGFIMIEPEELSHLEEKSARDGLKESRYYEGLRTMLKEVLSELEKRRFTFRQTKLKNTHSLSPQNQIDSLFDFTEFNSTLNSSLEEGLAKIINNPENAEELTQEIKKSVSINVQALEKQKNIEYEKVKEIIAIYQGQATLGKIVAVILHEGRKSLGWFSNQIPRTIKWLNRLGKEEKIDTPLFNKILDRLKTTEKESVALTRLFNKLDPLTTTRRSRKKNVDMKNVINHVFEIYEGELSTANIKFDFTSQDNTKVYGIEEDFMMCMTNLIENSIYWLKKMPSNERSITINIKDESKLLVIDIMDNGPGIEQDYIIDKSIFVPGFSGKSEGSGTGLGLAIAGEAIARNNGELKAVYSPEGAHFRIDLKKDGGTINE